MLSKLSCVFVEPQQVCKPILFYFILLHLPMMLLLHLCVSQLKSAEIF